MEYMTMKQTADLLQISYDHLFILIKEGRNHPPYFMVGCHKRFIREQVMEWAREKSKK